MGPIALISDPHPAYITPRSNAKTREPGIKVILVSKRETACHKPLDCRVYGTLGSKARIKFNRMISIEHNPPVMEEAAAKLVHDCWEELTRENVLDA
jgi:hypothetical protein